MQESAVENLNKFCVLLTEKKLHQVITFLEDLCLLVWKEEFMSAVKS